MKEQTNSKSQEGKATTIRKPFSRETSVQTTIFADPSIVWALLTRASDFPRWNSTVTSIKGETACTRSIKAEEAVSSFGCRKRSADHFSLCLPVTFLPLTNRSNDLQRI